MSSQSVNASTYSGYQASELLNYIPTRDPSDYTRMVRERIIYNENKTGSTVSPVKSSSIWLAYGNGFRLSYFQGRLKCGGCNPTDNGNAFAGNGPYVNNIGGISSS